MRILVVFLFVSQTSFFGQNQLGSDIDGELPSNWFGYSISMPSATTFASGAPLNDDIALNAGHVRVYDWTGTVWLQRGVDIDGMNATDRMGTVVSMPSNNTVGATLPGTSTSTNPYGMVKIYNWDGSGWQQKGATVSGISSSERIGSSFSMGDDNTFAVGSTGGATWPSNQAGKVYIYQWNGTNWALKGNPILGVSADDQFGYTVSMPDANTVAVSAPFNDESGNNSGQVRIFNFDGMDWQQIGGAINGEAAGNNSGISIDMPDSQTIAIGAPYNAGGIFQNGHTRIFSWNGSAWVQKGADIDGMAVAELSGFSVSMPDANTIGIGAPGNGESAPNSGIARVYSWNGSSWAQVGSSISGEAEDDESGRSVSMGSTSIIAIGAYENQGNGQSAGQVRLYDFGGTTSLGNEMGIVSSIYPNPVNDILNIKLNRYAENVKINIMTIEGKLIKSKEFNQKNTIQLDLKSLQGFFLLEVLSGEERRLETIFVN